MYKTLSRRTVVLSFLISGFFGILLVVQGLFVQEPISTFFSQKHSFIQLEKDKGFASSRWHPEWFRGRFFFVDNDLDLSSDVRTLLHKDWIFFPSFSLNEEAVDKLREDIPTGQALLIEFSENLYVNDVTTMQFDIHSTLSHQMYVNGTPLATKHNLTLSKGNHLWTLRVLVPPGENLDLQIQQSVNEGSWKHWKAGSHHGYSLRHGKNRTGFRMNVEDVFEQGSSNLSKGANSRLDDLWFGINEGRFLGRIVIEVHNKDGGMSLSQSRALELAKWLVENGSPSKLITVQGYGDHWLGNDDSGRVDILLLH